MARGWESKGVEESQREGADRRADQGPALTPEEREAQRRRASLELDRRRVLQEIETTRSEARKASLQSALAFLEGELAKAQDRAAEPQREQG